MWLKYGVILDAVVFDEIPFRCRRNFITSSFAVGIFSAWLRVTADLVVPFGEFIPKEEEDEFNNLVGVKDGGGSSSSAVKRRKLG